MLFLVFQLGADRYAIEAAQVVEVLPLLKRKQIPNAPTGVAGMIDYHGVPVPLIDLAELALGKPSRQWMSTRIILVNYLQEPEEKHLLGLVAERATETLRRSHGDFINSSLAAAGKPYLGPVTMDTAGIVQRVEIGALLSEEIRNVIFQERMDPV